MHGLTGGGWKRKRRPRSPRVGRPGRKLREYRPWDLPTITPPRLPPTLHGRFNRTQLYPLRQRINTYLMRWARTKYRRLTALKRFKGWWAGLVERAPACSLTGAGCARSDDEG
jgi:RNA-directed DNA polymerase